jgi:hypothetical protein
MRGARNPFVVEDTSSIDDASGFAPVALIPTDCPCSVEAVYSAITRACHRLLFIQPLGSRKKLKISFISIEYLLNGNVIQLVYSECRIKCVRSLIEVMV